jgi:RHS repeat-associated protein
VESRGTYSYQQGTNKLTHIEGTPPIDYGYDANGNITTENTWTSIYDLSNQLIRVLQGGNQVGEYTFNGAGQRIKKVTQIETRIFHYDLWGHLIAETNQSGQLLAEYIYLGDQLLAMIKPGEAAYYFHNDHLGTPQVLTDGTGSVSWKAAYTPFGQANITVGTVENPFRSPGQYYDQETGLHYNYFRYYNPPIGRYLTPDPIELRGGINIFAYVSNNPLLFIDAYGLSITGYRYECESFTDCMNRCINDLFWGLLEDYPILKSLIGNDALAIQNLIVNLDPAVVMSILENITPSILGLQVETKRVVSTVGLKNLREAGELRKGVSSYQIGKYGYWKVTTTENLFPSLSKLAPILVKIGLIKNAWDVGTYLGCLVNCTGKEE